MEKKRLPLVDLDKLNQELDNSSKPVKKIAGIALRTWRQLCVDFVPKLNLLGTKNEENEGGEHIRV